MIKTIVIRPNLGVDLAKEQGPGLYGSTRINPEKKIFEVLILHMKKIRNNPYEYMLYML
jgi:hypothetical protein